MSQGLSLCHLAYKLLHISLYSITGQGYKTGFRLQKSTHRITLYLKNCKTFCIICSSLNIYREAKIARENTNAPVRDDDGPRINEDIRVKEVRLIDENGENRGVVSIREALQIAADAGLDLIEISPQAVPPVCKVLDYGKYKYEAQKRKAEAKKNQKVIEIKELKLRPMIDKHDYEVKVKQAKRFLDEGNKVKFTMRYKGRELSANDMGKAVLDRLLEDLEGLCKVDSAPKLEGKQMMMIVSPEK